MYSWLPTWFPILSVLNDIPSRITKKNVALSVIFYLRYVPVGSIQSYVTPLMLDNTPKITITSTVFRKTTYRAEITHSCLHIFPKFTLGCFAHFSPLSRRWTSGKSTTSQRLQHSFSQKSRVTLPNNTCKQTNFLLQASLPPALGRRRLANLKASSGFITIACENQAT